MALVMTRPPRVENRVFSPENMRGRVDGDVVHGSKNSTPVSKTSSSHSPGLRLCSAQARIMFSTSNVERTQKRCEHCGHSRAAHVDGLRCALCGCVPGRRTFVQESFGFRRALQRPVTRSTRKR